MDFLCVEKKNYNFLEILLKSSIFKFFYSKIPVPLCVPPWCFKMFLIKLGFLYYTMSKQQYRSEMGIMGDILDVTLNGGQQGVIVSAISRRANLSHYAVLDKCEKLIEAGLVETKRDDRNRKFSITQKGLEFFQEFKTFRDLLESMNLRY